jgi:hypothetical protein
MFLSGTLSAAEWKLFEPTYVAIEATKYDGIHDTYLAPLDSELEYGGRFRINSNILRYGDFKLYWNNMLHFDQSNKSGHVKHAGWQYEFGLSLIPDALTIFKEHHSRHILEEVRPGKFPVYDMYGIRFELYRK